MSKEVSEEIFLIAHAAYSSAKHSQLRAALNTIAPRLRAEGMREAANIVADVHWARPIQAVTRVLAAADALDPPKETK